MASFKDDVDNDIFDFTHLPDMPAILDDFDDGLAFDNSQTIDTDSFYPNPAAWNLQDTPPYDRGLYSNPFSWDSPQTRSMAPQDIARPVYSSVSTTLTPAQQERLRNIAMPDHLQYRSRRSPGSAAPSSTYKSSSISSPDQQNASRKRKTSCEEDGDDDDDDDEGSNSQHPPVKKTAHNMIEKRYRTNLNDKIAALRDSVPSLRVITKTSKGQDGGEVEDLQGLTPAHKLNKATVLSKATEYIRHLEKRNTRLSEENASMKARIAAFEKLFLSGSLGINPTPQPNTYYRNDQYATPPNNGQHTPAVSPPGMIKVPEDIRRMNAQAMLNAQIYAPQENYSPRNRQHTGPVNGWNGGGYFGKMMVGSLAGLMILEGFSEGEQEVDSPNARGLFAIPTHILSAMARGLRSSTSINVLGYHSSSADTLAFVKLILVLFTLLWVFVPSLFSSSRNPKFGKMNLDHLATAPSLASPIAVRRQAWLTAIQTVWVPRHNFFMEVAALILKMAKLSLRNVIGWYGFALLTGITEQQEAARIKAWGIALDSQLAGGDIEVNKTRLALTLLASDTLPDTPARLMLKALHIQVLLWELGNARIYGFSAFHTFAAKLAQWKWNEARQLQDFIKHTRSRSTTEEFEPLPEHLTALLEQDCEDILIDSITQRAYNLTFNLPTTQNVIGVSDGMDSVVEDHAIRSPLDAVSAWYSSLVLQHALATSLSTTTNAEDKVKNYLSMTKDIELAIRTAPIGSGAQIRALVARAVLKNEKRGEHIAAVYHILAPATKGKNTPAITLINATTSITTLPDLRMSINCAMAIGHLGKPGPPAPVVYTLIDATWPARMSLLGFAAAFKLMETLAAHEEANVTCSRKLENLAGTLRIWIGNGGRGGGESLPKKTRDQVVERCLGITKSLVGVGLEKDAGYETMSESEAGEGC